MFSFRSMTFDFSDMAQNPMNMGGGPRPNMMASNSPMTGGQMGAGGPMNPIGGNPLGSLGGGPASMGGTSPIPGGHGQQQMGRGGGLPLGQMTIMGGGGGGAGNFQGRPGAGGIMSQGMGGPPSAGMVPNVASPLQPGQLGGGMGVPRYGGGGGPNTLVNNLVGGPPGGGGVVRPTGVLGGGLRMPVSPGVAAAAPPNVSLPGMGAAPNIAGGEAPGTAAF
jgi:hypothetical protein